MKAELIGVVALAILALVGILMLYFIGYLAMLFVMPLVGAMAGVFYIIKWYRRKHPIY